MPINSNPAASDPRMPAEWEPHDATWIAWPHQRDDWPGKFEPVPWVYAEIIRHLGRHEKIELIVKDIAARNQARKVLVKTNARNESVQFHLWPTDRVWTRDSGCTFVLTTSYMVTGGGARRYIKDLLAITWRSRATHNISPNVRGVPRPPAIELM